jgi:hypothetical protein
LYRQIKVLPLRCCVRALLARAYPPHLLRKIEMLLSAGVPVCRCSSMQLMIHNLLAGLVSYRERDGAKLRS